MPVPTAWVQTVEGRAECTICGGELQIDIRDLLGEDNLMGYTMREPQFDMATKIDQLLEEGRQHSEVIKAWCLKKAGRKNDPNWMRFRNQAMIKYGTFEPFSGIIEGKTGVGKTLAYLAPSVVSSGHRVVIATANKALQKQILEDDGPAICDAVGKVLDRPKIVVKKGKSNYICLAAAQKLKSGPRTRPGWGASIERAEENMQLQDKDALDPKPEWADFASVTACPGAACKFSDSCLYFQNKLDLEEANVVVTNQHSLALEYALQLKMGGKAPDLLFGERSGVIIDEAHNFADIVRWAFSEKTELERASAQLDDWGYTSAADKIAGLQTYLNGTRPAVPYVITNDDSADGSLLMLLTDIETTLSSAKAHADSAATMAWTTWRNIKEGNAPGDVNDAFDDLREAQSVARGVSTHLSTFKNAGELEYNAVWFSKNQKRNWELETSPINIQPILKNFWEQYATIMTSATISSGGNFGQFRRKLGIRNIPKENELIVGSPFNYAQRTAMYVTDDPMLLKPSYGATEGEIAAYYDHMADEICEWLELTGGRAMVLFASRQDMDEFWARVPRHRNVAHLDFIVQTPDTPASMLPEKFMELAKSQINIRPRQGPVMLGLASIWEGISIKYDHMVNVIIPRIPFLNNNDPVHQRLEQTLTQRYLEEGMEPKKIGLRIFQDLQVYEASIKLRQGTGRLLRTRKDAGICVLLDFRFKSKRYGGAILRDLDAGVNRFHHKDTVRDLFKQIDAGLTAMRDGRKKK